jgi:hypothetical protein
MGRHDWIEGSLAAAAVFTLCLAIAPATNAQTAEGKRSPEVSGPFVWTTGAKPSVSRLRADLIQRGGGEWVLVDLRPREADPGDEPARTRFTTIHPNVSAVLREYERAFEQRDTNRLASVLLMDVSERAQVQRLFDQSSSISLSIQNVDVFVEAGRASLHFDQRMVASARPSLGRAAESRAQRALFAHDAYGNWRGVGGSN